MTRIQQLSPQIANKIAAGEVIERPASVVKELLENAVDALATRIDVEIREGGSELIRISDNGEGIHADDLPLAIASHATSKLATADDLFRICTFGFRGEALASIAEISRFKIRSRQAGDIEGHELSVDLGERGEVRPCGCPVGTSIEVADLFANTPVRRKFLKGTSTEFGHIAEQFTRIALACPRLHLVLRHNGREVYELPGTNQLLDRIGLFFGREFADQLIPVESELGAVRLWGYVGHPALSKATRKGQYLFLNGRWIQDRSLQHALTEAYRGLIMIGRNPVSVLFLEMPPDQVDVNVHPTKSEVRFQDSQPLYRQLLAMLRQKFLGMNLDSRLKLTGTGKTAREVDPAEQEQARQELVSWAREQSLQWTVPADDASATDWAAVGSRQAVAMPAGPALPRGSGLVLDRAHRTDNLGAELDRQPVTTGGPRSSSGREPDAVWDWAPSTTEQPEPSSAHDLLQSAFDAEADTVARSMLASGRAITPLPEVIDDPARLSTGTPLTGYPRDLTEPSNGPIDAVATPCAESNPEAVTVTSAEVAVPAAGRPIAPAAIDFGARALQVHDSYLVLETSEGLAVIDQHALHERIMYEQLRTRVLAGKVESQRLLIPQPIDVTPVEADLLRTHRALVAETGLQVDEFGGNTVLLTAYPTLLRRVEPARIIRDLLDLLSSVGEGVSRRDLLDKLLHMMACKAAVKAGQRLTPEEIDALLAQRHLIQDAHHCPHGRPTALVLSRSELDRQFGRLG